MNVDKREESIPMFLFRMKQEEERKDRNLFKMAHLVGSEDSGK